MSTNVQRCMAKRRSTLLHALPTKCLTSSQDPSHSTGPIDGSHVDLLGEGMLIFERGSCWKTGHPQQIIMKIAPRPSQRNVEEMRCKKSYKSYSPVFEGRDGNLSLWAQHQRTSTEIPSVEDVASLLSKLHRRSSHLKFLGGCYPSGGTSVCKWNPHAHPRTRRIGIDIKIRSQSMTLEVNVPYAYCGGLFSIPASHHVAPKTSSSGHCELELTTNQSQNS
ncbi:hypothetical protein VNO77_44278 [Canavalia gladiata]|uniref:Uncharacterized protein n=1 Tax=Canavalia gladiata TaxID=3824 RepID=A0AAN9JVM7_CANGL